MDYSNSEMKLDQLIAYFNEGKINLIPPFQRGHVWTLKMRQGLIKNIVNRRPIPAIFLYKEALGSKYTYNILDGKQRLESLLLFVGNKRADVGIPGVKNYFFSEREKQSVGFSIQTLEGNKTFEDLSEGDVRDFREYAIPTIEINLDDSSLDEIIELFIDINQQGSKVNRFDIVKAMGKNPLLKDIFDLIAVQQERGKDIFYKKRQTDYTRVIEKLQIVQNLPNPNSRIDRMWERLLEIVLFCRTKKHRAPAQILKGFIRSYDKDEKSKISIQESKQLKACFKFLSQCYKNSDFIKSKFATDQTHFYTMVTSILFKELLKPVKNAPPSIQKLKRKLIAFAKIVEGKMIAPKEIASSVKDYIAASQKQTTHVGQREERQRLFLKIIDAL